MANEISIAAALSARVGNVQLAAQATTQADQTSPGGVQRRQTVPTSDTALTLTGVATPRAIHITNLDATNYVDIGPESGGAIVALIRLRAGETCVFPIKPGTVIRAQANTASVTIESLVLET